MSGLGMCTCVDCVPIVPLVEPNVDLDVQSDVYVYGVRSLHSYKGHTEDHT